jgi:ribosomal protein S27AE
MERDDVAPSFEENRTCPKCGGVATAKWDGFAFIERKCVRCGYGWDERPLDGTQ